MIDEAAAQPATGGGAEQPIEALTAGARLKAARESAQLSVADVATRLKYSPRQVQALEDGNSDALPSLTFQRGFVRGYAKLLGLNANELVAVLESRAGVDNGPNTLQLQQVAYTPSAMPMATGQQSRWPWVLGMLLAVAGIGGYALYDWEAPSTGKRENVTPVVPGVAPSAPAVPERTAGIGAGEPLPTLPDLNSSSAERPIPLPQPVAQVVPPLPVDEPQPTATGGKLRFVFGGESWTEVRQANGEVVFSGTGLPGMERWADGQPPFDLVIGNAKKVRLFYRGAEIGLTPYIKLSVARLQLK